MLLILVQSEGFIARSCLAGAISIFPALFFGKHV